MKDKTPLEKKKELWKTFLKQNNLTAIEYNFVKFTKSLNSENSHLLDEKK